MARDRLFPPSRGATDAQTFIDMPADMGPVTSMRNMRPQQGTGRRRLATRPGTVAAFTNTFNGAVQALTNVGKASGISGYTVSAPVAVTDGNSWAAGTLRTQCLVLDTDWSCTTAFSASNGDPALAAPAADYGGVGAYNTCFHNTDANIGYYLTISTQDTVTGVPGVYVSQLNRVNLTTRAITNQVLLVDMAPPVVFPTGGVSQFPNKMVAFGAYLFVAVSDYIYIYDAGDLEYINRVKGGWAQEYQAVSCVRINDVDYLLSAHIGTASIVGPVVLDVTVPPERFGEFYRSGIELWRIAYAADGVSALPGGGIPLVRVQLPMGTQSGDPGYEDHRSFRISEWSSARPRGGLIYDFAVDSDGNVYIGRTSQGWGYDSTKKPDGTTPHVTLCKGILEAAFETSPPVYIDPDAVPLGTFYGMDALVGGWEIDTVSYRRAYTWGANTWYNDIPAIDAGTGARMPELAASAPSAYAVALDETNDRVYVGGVASANRGNVVCVRATTGEIMWEVDVVGLVNQNAIAVDPTTGNVVVGILRAAQSGTWGTAELVELDRVTGSIVRVFDLTDGIVFNGKITGASTNVGVMDLAINSDGKVLVALAPYRYDV